MVFQAIDTFLLLSCHDMLSTEIQLSPGSTALSVHSKACAVNTINVAALPAGLPRRRGRKHPFHDRQGLL